MARIIKNDTVIVISGKDKGKEGVVVRVIPRRNKVIVQGVNMVYRHVRKNKDYPQGARIQKEAPMDLSNVMLKDPKTGKPTRVKFVIDPKATGPNRKVRVAKVSGAVIDRNTTK